MEGRLQGAYEQRKGKVLLVDDNEDVLLSLNLLLKPHVEAVRAITKPERIIEFMDSFIPDVILLDMNFRRDAISGEEGYEWLEAILKHNPRSVVLFITAYVDTEKAVRAIKAGAIDFIPKPWDKQKMLDTVRSGIELSYSRQGKEAVQSVRDETFSRMIGECPAMLDVKRQIARVAVTDANVLVTGENGTGKDVAAHALHELSARSGKQFVCIDLGCIPETLFEGELFGYEKGAFTDARTTREGRVEAADGGTLFLDEIGNLSAQTQQKLLTVIEKRVVSRIGSNKSRNVDVRLVCATNADLYAKVRTGEFRQDLLYRINTIELHLPPLRERGHDVILLAEHFVRVMAAKYGKAVPSLAESAMQKLLQHSWPGNIRELQHCMERAIVLSGKAVLEAEDIPLERRATSTVLPAPVDRQNAEQSHLGGEGQDGGGPTFNLEELERRAIARAISASNGNLTRAAELLGITRFALYRKIEKLGI